MEAIWQQQLINRQDHHHIIRSTRRAMKFARNQTKGLIAQRQRRKGKGGWSLLSLSLLFKFQRLYYYLFGNGLQLNSLNHHDRHCYNVVNAEMKTRPRMVSSLDHWLAHQNWGCLEDLLSCFRTTSTFPDSPPPSPWTDTKTSHKSTVSVPSNYMWRFLGLGLPGKFQRRIGWEDIRSK